MFLNTITIYIFHSKFFSKNVFPCIQAINGTACMQMMRQTLQHLISAGQGIVIICKNRRMIGQQIRYRLRLIKEEYGW